MFFDLKRYLLVGICLFATTSFLSIAATNVLLSLNIILFFVFLYKKKSFIVDEDKVLYLKAIIFFGITLVISAFFSGELAQGLKLWADFFIWRFFPFLILILVFDKKEATQKIFYTILGAFLLDAMYVIYQGCFVYQLNIAHFRPYGFTGHPMTFAGFLCIIVPILLVAVFEDGVLGMYNKLALPAVIVGLGALLFNSTRGAWFALVIVIGLICLNYMFHSKKIFIYCVLMLFVGGGMLANNQYFMERIKTFSTVKSIKQDARFKIWDVSFALFREHPFLGVGLGQFKSAYKDNFYKIHPIDIEINQKSEKYKSYWYNNKIKKLTVAQKSLTQEQVFELRDAYVSIRDNEKIRNLTHAHNNFLQMLAENGMVGFIGYVFAFGYILWINIKNYFANKNPYALMIAGSTGALVLQGLTEYNFGNGAVMKLYWFVLGCLVVLAGCYNKEFGNN